MTEIRKSLDAGQEPPCMEMAGPRERIFFDPSKLKCGIVTCGGLCPGLNNVIRGIVLSLFHHYGVKHIFGFPFGYEGLSSKHGHAPIELTPQLVTHINELGGTILGSSMLMMLSLLGWIASRLPGYQNSPRKPRL